MDGTNGNTVQDRNTSNENEEGMSEEAQARAAETLKTLGEVVFLMTLSPAHKHMFLADLEWLGLPAIAQNQCFMHYDKGRVIAASFWASVNGEVEDRFKKGVMKLTPQEWRSGDNLWLVNVIDPFKRAEDTLREFAAAENAANKRDFKFITNNAEGQRVVVTTNAEKMKSE